MASGSGRLPAKPSETPPAVLANLPNAPALPLDLLPINIPDVRPWWTRVRPTAHYLAETEAHVYALAISASVLLAFFPFLTVMVSLCRDVFHWHAAEEAINLALKDQFAGEVGKFISYHLGLGQ